MNMLRPFKLIVESFRKFRNIEFELGNKITVISGQNGVGKSNLLSLISSASGVNKKSLLNTNFQPEFYDFFNIDVDENYEDYKIFLKYVDENNEVAITKRLAFKNDTKTGRGVRIIPRTTNKFSNEKTLREAENNAKEKYGVGGAARINIPTIYLSLSRLYPLGEKKESVVVTKINKANAFYQKKANEKYKKWYNSVIPNSVKEESKLSIIDKKMSSRPSLSMDIIDTPILSQSIGQDNVGNIISALVDIYMLSLDSDYHGAILCIDEIEVSLHPDTQIRMFNLFDQLSDELSIQFILSTHSLTILKEILRKEKTSNNKYKLVYLKNPSAPILSERKTYRLLKADMFGELSFKKDKVKIYFEDEVGKTLFDLLLKAFREIYIKVKSHVNEPVLRNSEGRIDYFEINEEICKFNSILNIEDQIEKIVLELGCEELFKVNLKDKYFKRVIFILDGDARYKESIHKPKIKDFLIKKYNPNEFRLNDRKHEKNICFLPDYFAPESFLYYIIYHICENEYEHLAFWRDLDAEESTALLTPDKIKSLFESLKTDFDNDDLKRIFKSVSNSNVWDFIINTDIVTYYYSDYNTIKELLIFIEKFKKAYDLSYNIVLSKNYL